MCSAYKVVESPEVRERFLAAARFRRDFYGQNSARKLLASREQAIARLETLPYSSPSLTVEGLDLPLHWLMVDVYVLVYRVDESAKIVLLDGLFYASENWRAILGVDE